MTQPPAAPINAPPLPEPPALDDLRCALEQATQEERSAFIESLEPATRHYLLFNALDLFLHAKQIITGDDWRYFLFQGGRGTGKSVAGSAWIAKQVNNGFMSLAIVAPTYKDLTLTMIPAIKAWFPKDSQPVYHSTEHTLTFSTGCICYCFTSQEETRGYNIQRAWCDELARWSGLIPAKALNIWEVFDDCVRVEGPKGQQPQILHTSTGRNWALFKQFHRWASTNNADRPTRVTIGSSLDNPWLSERAKRNLLAKYKGTKRLEQEVYGGIAEDDAGALWNAANLEANRVEAPPMKTLPGGNQAPEFYRVVIAVDPAMSITGDETGIIVAGLGMNGHAYVLDDRSGNYEPLDWAERVSELFNLYVSMGYRTSVVAEKNQGGQLVYQNIIGVNPRIKNHIQLEHASVGKKERAQPVAAKYAQNMVHHVGGGDEDNKFIQLEDQLTNWTGNPKEKSPDRLDGLVYAITDLLCRSTEAYRDLDNFPNVF
jgi:phage terminase large subunit-like protein